VAAPAVPDARDEAERALRARALRTSIGKDVVQMAAFSLAGAWALGTFAYREAYLPRRADAALVAKSSLERAGERDDVVALKFRWSVANTSHATMRILAANVRVRGWRVRRVDGPPSADEPPSSEGWEASRNNVEPADVDTLSSVGERVGARLAPGSSHESDWLLYADRRKFDAVRVYLEIVLFNETLGEPFRAEWLEVKPGEGGGALGARYVIAPACLRLGNRCPLGATMGQANVSLWP
jgi:hypothetical protein